MDLNIVSVGLEWQPDVIKLRAVVPRDCFMPIDLPPEQKPTVIMVDMETTDLS